MNGYFCLNITMSCLIQASVSIKLAVTYIDNYVVILITADLTGRRPAAFLFLMWKWIFLDFSFCLLKKMLRMSTWTSDGSMLSWFNKRGVSVVQGWLNFRAWGRIKTGAPSVPVSSPGLWVISKDIEKGVHAGFELPGSENVREMGNVAFPPAREQTGFIRQKQPTWQSDTPAWAQVALIRGFWYVRL